MPLAAHLRLVEEDAAEMVAVGEHLGLVRQVRAAAVDQVDARQAVGLGDFLRAEVLLDRQRIISAALHRRVVADDHHLAPATRGRCRRSSPRPAPRRRTCRRRRAGRFRGTASRDRAAARRGRGAAVCRARRGARDDFSLPPFAASATSARSFSASARLCLARARDSSLDRSILLSSRGALIACQIPVCRNLLPRA